MGKYMRKAKTNGEVAVMEFPQTSCTVRTRAKTLALQNLQEDSSVSCLQLRNRRLEKPNLALKQPKPSGKETSKQNPEINLGPTNPNPNEEEEDLGVEASFWDNNLELDARDRSTRESPPCSLIRGADPIGTPPGSSTRRTSFTHQVWNPVRDMPVRDMPTTHEMEEFFSFAEQEQERLFTVKYNFDVANELPRPGRYEWVRV